MNLRQINLVNLKQFIVRAEDLLLEHPLLTKRNLVIFNFSLMAFCILSTFLSGALPFLKSFSVLKDSFELVSVGFVMHFLYQYTKNETYRPSIDGLIFWLTALNIMILIGLMWIKFIVFVVSLF